MFVCSTGKASQLYSYNLAGLFEQARQMQKLPVAIPTHKLPDKIIPRYDSDYLFIFIFRIFFLIKLISFKYLSNAHPMKSHHFTFYYCHGIAFLSESLPCPIKSQIQGVARNAV